MAESVQIQPFWPESLHKWFPEEISAALNNSVRKRSLMALATNSHMRRVGERRGAARSLRIIVADDDRDQVLTLMMLLRDEGHEVQGVYSGSRVLPSIREFDPDVVLLDIALPDKSGYQLAEEIRKRPRGQRVLLVGISGQYKQSSDKILAQLNGFDHYLVKPFEPAARAYRAFRQRLVRSAPAC